MFIESVGQELRPSMAIEISVVSQEGAPIGSEGATTSTSPGIERVLVVDEEVMVREILVRKLQNMGYTCRGAQDGRTAINLLEKQNYDLLLTDISKSEVDRNSFLTSVYALHPDMAVILMTSVANLEVAVACLKEGAYDYILKPFGIEEVAVSVDRALDKRRLYLENRQHRQNLEDQVALRTRQFKEALETLHHTYHSTLLALGTALDSRDADSDGQHSLRVTLYTTRLARHIGVSQEDLSVIEQGALLHDIGKIGVPDDLLRKPGPLTEDEWILMQRHPEIGYRILSGINYLRGAAVLVLHHHERFDGRGYPAGLKGDEIYIGARIFSVVDTLDCMTSSRPFQTATSFEAARDEIVRVSGTQLDPNIVGRFLEISLDEWREIRREVAYRTSLNRLASLKN